MAISIAAWPLPKPQRPAGESLRPVWRVLRPAHERHRGPMPIPPSLSKTEGRNRTAARCSTPAGSSNILTNTSPGEISGRGVKVCRSVSAYPKKEGCRCGPAAPGLEARDDGVYASTLMTTRRFWARPSRVLFGGRRLVFAVADHVHLVERHLVLLVEIHSSPLRRGSGRGARCTSCRRRCRCALRSRSTPPTSGS